VSQKILSVLTWLVTGLAPLAIVMLVVRLMLTPLLLQVEYRMPGFPEDSYGFTQQDRLRWATPSLDYLTNSAGIEFLGNLKFDDGMAIYNERELSHMLDVKNVVQVLLKVWYVALILLIGLGLWAWRANGLDAYRLGWQRGGFFTIGLLVALGVFAVTSFDQFFIWFHSLFFQGSSWLFLYSDTLIRLFPIRFWEDCVAYIAGLSVVISLACAFGLKPVRK
jgi:integral membrane protein (TIGR01906 family)